MDFGIFIWKTKTNQWNHATSNTGCNSTGGMWCQLHVFQKLIVFICNINFVIIMICACPLSVHTPHADICASFCPNIPTLPCWVCYGKPHQKRHQHQIPYYHPCGYGCSGVFDTRATVATGVIQSHVCCWEVENYITYQLKMITFLSCICKKHYLPASCSLKDQPPCIPDVIIHLTLGLWKKLVLNFRDYTPR